MGYFGAGDPVRLSSQWNYDVTYDAPCAPRENGHVSFHCPLHYELVSTIL